MVGIASPWHLELGHLHPHCVCHRQGTRIWTRRRTSCTEAGVEGNVLVSGLFRIAYGSMPMRIQPGLQSAGAFLQVAENVVPMFYI